MSRLSHLLIALAFVAVMDEATAACDYTHCVVSTSTCSAARKYVDCLKGVVSDCSGVEKTVLESIIDGAEKSLDALKCGACGLTSSLAVCLVLSAIAHFLSDIKRAN